MRARVRDAETTPPRRGKRRRSELRKVAERFGDPELGTPLRSADERERASEVARARRLEALPAAEQPDVLYMPSVGMFVLTVFMSNLRVAPLQVAGLGHPATTHSDRIDCVSVEEDYVGDPACFSERLLKLPKDGQPYRPSVALPEIVARIPPPRERLEIVITASAMNRKVNTP